MKLSIVATLYKSAPYIGEFVRRSTAAARELVGDDYEIVLVNDGSPDNSLDIAVNLTKTDPHLVVVDLSRNFGHHKAMMTGLAHAQGERVFLIDSDLEEEPEWLLPFARQMEEEKCDVVYGVQGERKGCLWERVFGQIAYKLYNLLLSIDHPRNIVTARLMKRDYVQSLLQHEEREICISGLWYLTGYDQREHVVKKHASSTTTYSYLLKIGTFVNSVTSFSITPLKAIFFSGLFIIFIALLYIIYILLQWTFFQKPLAGWPSVIASIWLLGGITIFFIGVIGIYLAKMFSEIKRRPFTIVKKIYRF
ncbi:putative glycosyltransferase [Desulfonatronum zhilinae]|nr:putative glycosyltransferase [Desulfonatronum zhilinae]